MLHNTPFSFVVRSPKCFCQIYWPTSGCHMQQCFKLVLSHVVTTVVLTVIKIIKNRVAVKIQLGYN